MEKKRKIPGKGGGGWVSPPQKGEVRNPHGNRGQKSFKKLLKKFLADEIDLDDFTGTLKMSKKDAIAFLMIRDATDADQDPAIRLRAAITVMDRVEGEPKKTQDINLKYKESGNAAPATPEQLAELKRIFAATPDAKTDNGKVPDTSRK